MLGLIFLIVGALVSCGIDVENKPQETRQRAVDPPKNGARDGLWMRFASVEIPGERRFYIDKAGLKEPLAVGEVWPGDRVLIRLTGKSVRPVAGDEYGWTAKSQWSVNKCRTPKGVRATGPDPHSDCYNEIQSGSCRLKYRNRIGWDESDMDFSDLSEENRIRIGIGEKPRYLGKIIHSDRAEMVIEFVVTARMLEEKQTDQLVLHPPRAILPEAEKIRFGFMGFGNCPDRLRRDVRNFRHNGHEVPEYAPAERMEYTIDIIIKPDNNNEKLPLTGAKTNPKGGFFYV